MNQTDIESLLPLSQEMGQAEFGNLHLTKRYERMLDQIMEHPGESFPDIFTTEAELEGAYRFLRNPNVTWQKALQPHLEATKKKAKKVGKILVLHDTTEFSFSGEREGLGYINQTSGRGFFGHFAFAVSADVARIPLGVIGLEINSREGTPKRTPSYKSYRDANRESLRWKRLVQEVHGRVSSEVQIIHVTDREGDIYEVLDEICYQKQSFVIRLSHDRALKDLPGHTVSDALDGLNVVCEREVPLSRRENKKKRERAKTNSPRERRMARLAFTATTVQIRRPLHHNQPHSRELHLNIVHVDEVNPPPGEEKVEWKLITTEPIKTPQDIMEIVDIYRTRWLIEEYFKALKTGCNYEKRQLESLQTLLNALSLLVPVAHRLLLLRNLSRTAPNLPALCVITKTQLNILHALPNSKLPQTPSVRDVLLEIARIGGHIKNNGDPGWLTIWRGYRKLLLYAVGWMAKSDQS